MKAKMALELWLEQPEEWISGMGSALGLAGLELMNQVSSLGMLCPRCLLDDGHSKVSHFTSLVAMAVGRNALSSVLCPMPSGQGTDPHLSARILLRQLKPKELQEILTITFKLLFGL